SAIIIGSLVWILLLALVSQTVSALVKWRIVASGAMLGLFLIPSVFGEFVNQVFRTRWGNLISLGALMKSVTSGLFGTFLRVYETVMIRDFDDNVVRSVVVSEPPLWLSWAMLFLICAVCLAILHWKVKAYEVVR